MNTPQSLRPTLPVCNICNSNQSVHISDLSKKLYRCEDCDHIFVLIDDAYSTDTIYADEYFESAHKNWFKYPNYTLFEYIRQSVLKRLDKHDFKLLDVGCGRGDLLSYLRKKEPAADLYGIDGAPCSNPDFRFIQGDFMKVALPDDFLAITSLACIEHVDDPDLFAKRLRQAITSQGLVVIMTVNANSLMYRLSALLHKVGIHAGYDRLYSEHHIHHFTNNSLKRVLENNGFRVVSQKNHNFSLASADFPAANPAMTFLYKTFTAIVFFWSSLFQNGFLQTVICVVDEEKFA